MLASLISDPTRQGAPISSQEIGLTDLKAQLTTLSEEVSRIAADRARQAAKMAEAGVDATRETVSDYPMASLATAFAAGAVLGLVLTQPARSSRTWGSDFRDVGDNLGGYAHDLQQNLRNSVSNTSMADQLERLSSALSAADAKGSIGPAVDRVLGWFNQAKSATNDAVAKVTA